MASVHIGHPETVYVFTALGGKHRKTHEEAGHAITTTVCLPGQPISGRGELYIGYRPTEGQGDRVGLDRRELGIQPERAKRKGTVSLEGRERAAQNQKALIRKHPEQATVYGKRNAIWESSNSFLR